ncbi:MAG: SGNH/GDSL hydrolase family protein [Victivallaceae bacterium]
MASRVELAPCFQPEQTSRQREAIEWSITYAYNATDADHLRLLLIGDSICNDYQRFVREKLEKRLNVSFWATSKCVTDPDYFRELEFILGSYRYDLITFNNGLHSLSTDPAEWEDAFRRVLALIRAKCPDAKLFVVSSTPLTDEAKNRRVEAINATAARLAAEAGLPLIDLYGAMAPLERERNWRDVYHFHPAAVALQADALIAALPQELLSATDLQQMSSETGPDGRIG